MANNLFNEAVSVLLADAEKSGNTDRELVKKMVRMTIDDINRQVEIGSLRVSDTLSVTADDDTYELPSDFGSMIVIGEKHATDDRVLSRWTYLGDIRYTKRHENATSSQTGKVNSWFLIEPAANHREQIMLSPTPSSSFTAKLVYYAHLTQSNLDRLKWVQPLVNGTKRLMPKWFPSAGTHFRNYMDDIGKLRPPRTADPMRPMPQRSDVRAYNRLMATL